MKRILLLFFILLLITLVWCTYTKTSYEIIGITFQKTLSDGSSGISMEISKPSEIKKIEGIINSIDWDKNVKVDIRQPDAVLTIEYKSAVQNRKVLREKIRIWFGGSAMNDENWYGRMNHKKAMELEKILSGYE
ncbi:MAG: hypothetical protein K0R18_1334 [Bacillales bacterium]|jgi:hypothetical protein|nr:hypothetical protein [Bacillales bacterium]